MQAFKRVLDLILRISGFEQSKTGKEYGALFSGFSSDLQKKKVFGVLRSSGPRNPIGPSHGPLQAYGAP